MSRFTDGTPRPIDIRLVNGNDWLNLSIAGHAKDIQITSNKGSISISLTSNFQARRFLDILREVLGDSDWINNATNICLQGKVQKKTFNRMDYVKLGQTEEDNDF